MDVDFDVADQTVTDEAEQTHSLADWLDGVDEADLKAQEVKRAGVYDTICSADLLDVDGQPMRGQMASEWRAGTACAFIVKGSVYVSIPKSL